MAVREEEDGAEQWQSSDHKTCPTKTQHGPRFKSLPSWRGKDREQMFLLVVFFYESTAWEFFLHFIAHMVTQYF